MATNAARTTRKEWAARRPHLTLNAESAASHGALRRLDDLLSEHADLQRTLEALRSQQEALRAEMSEIIAEIGPVEVPARHLRLEMTAPTVVVRYDRRGLERLVDHLREDGFREIADAIEEHRREDSRAGFFRIAVMKPAQETEPPQR